MSHAITEHKDHLLKGMACAVTAYFMLSTMIPQSLSDPPKYDMIFSMQDHSSTPSPLAVNYVVKGGTLKAQYTKNHNSASYYGWKKLYLFDAKTQKVRELSSGLPADSDSIVTMREETIDATKNLKLDTNLEAPDGYQLSYDGYSRSGFMNDLFWNGGYNNETRLRKGASSVKLMGSDSRTYFYYGYVQFIGWVIP